MDCLEQACRYTITTTPAATGVDKYRFILVEFDDGANFTRLARLAWFTTLTN